LTSWAAAELEDLSKVTYLDITFLKQQVSASYCSHLGCLNKKLSKRFRLFNTFQTRQLLNSYFYFRKECGPYKVSKMVK